jgi:hypothetical protein
MIAFADATATGRDIVIRIKGGAASDPLNMA